MKVNSEIFRAYDIRGIVDEGTHGRRNISDRKTIGSHILSEGRSSILTARDGRISGPRLLNQFQKRSDVFQGVTLLISERFQTPLLYFSTFRQISLMV
ncbi:MAG: hypothetical protein CM15mP13_2070 [Pseudomonadota bacterium]|nr:MAG: hypothetical protein CM15mP13_2070 [Pseudomonadota bacterium]